MFQSMIRASLASIAFLGAAGYSGAVVHGDGPVNDPFAGEWTFNVTPDTDAAADGQGSFDESVLFHEGQFSAAVFAMYGFTPADYTVTSDNSGTHFTATLVSSGKGTLIWTGDRNMLGLSGSLLWSRADGQQYHYDVVGEQQAAMQQQ